MNLLILIVISVLFVACTKIPTDEYSPLSMEMQSKFEAALDKVMLENYIPGVIVGVWMGNEGSWIKAKGVSNLATNEPMRVDNHFRMASITKTFTGTIVLQLVDEGKIKLDSSLAYYLPQYKFRDANKITVRYLGNMRSGIYSYSGDSALLAQLKATNYSHTYPADTLVKIALTHPSLFPAGQFYNYCNTNTILLGLICEKVTGKSIRELYNEKIIIPNGLVNTYYPESTFLPEPYSHGYTDQTLNGEIQDATYFNPSWAGAAGILITDLYDLKKWIKLIVNGSLYSPAMHAERMKFVGNYGFAIASGNDWVGHGGVIRGYTSNLYYHAGKDVTIVINVNSDINKPDSDVTPADAVFEAIAKVAVP